MTDPRVDEYARLLVGRSIDAQPGAQVLVATTTEARPLAEELSRGSSRGAAPTRSRGSRSAASTPSTSPGSRRRRRRSRSGCRRSSRSCSTASTARSSCSPPRDPPRDAELTAEARRGYRAQFTAYRARGRAGLVPEVRCDFPTRVLRAPGRPLARRVRGRLLRRPACATGTRRGARMQPVLERFDRARAGADRRAGHRPDAEPRRPHGRDRRRAPERPRRGGLLLPGRGLGRGDDPLRLPVRARSRASGSCSAAARSSRRRRTAGEDVLHQALETDAGARRLRRARARLQRGDHAPPPQRPLRREDGRHRAPRARRGLPAHRRPNESALHWDLVKDMRDGGELWCDGELVQRDGEWLL